MFKLPKRFPEIWDRGSNTVAVNPVSDGVFGVRKPSGWTGEPPPVDGRNRLSGRFLRIPVAFRKPSDAGVHQEKTPVHRDRSPTRIRLAICARLHAGRTSVARSSGTNATFTEKHNFMSLSATVKKMSIQTAIKARRPTDKNAADSDLRVRKRVFIRLNARLFGAHRVLRGLVLSWTAPNLSPTRHDRLLLHAVLCKYSLFMAQNGVLHEWCKIVHTREVSSTTTSKKKFYIKINKEI